MSKQNNNIIDADTENKTDSILERAINDAKKKKSNIPNEKIIIGSRKKKNKKTKAKRCKCK